MEFHRGALSASAAEQIFDDGSSLNVLHSRDVTFISTQLPAEVKNESSSVSITRHQKII